MKRFVLLIAIILISISFILLIYLGNPPARISGKTAVIYMIAKQWRFEVINATGILGYNFTEVSKTLGNLTIYVEKNTFITMIIKSIDVPHGIAVQGYQVNALIPVNEYVEIKFLADKTGTFRFYCTVFCGTGHRYHYGYLVVK